MKWHLDIGRKKSFQDQKKIHYPLRIIYKTVDLAVMHGIDILAFDSQRRVCVVTFNIMLFRTFAQVLLHLKSNNINSIHDRTTWNNSVWKSVSNKNSNQLCQYYCIITHKVIKLTTEYPKPHTNQNKPHTKTPQRPHSIKTQQPETLHCF